MFGPTLDNALCTLLEQLKADQRARWRGGQARSLEQYVNEHPTLAANKAAILDLIQNEIGLRTQLGDFPRPEDYVDRFPQLAMEIRRCIAGDESSETIGGNSSKWLPPAEPATVPSAVGPSPPTPLVVPGYRIERELGRGGMGVVYLAEQVHPRRTVALKMIRQGSLSGPNELVRFVAEAEVVAAVVHANVVRLYQVGEHQGLPYFTLEYVPGGALGDRLSGPPMPSQDAARLIEKVARGVAAAHSKGIIHRDLKPANVLLGDDGEPKVTDFGLARRVEAPSGLTATGNVMGTPSYMAPEQARGSKDIGVAVDVYGIGATLYECLAGRPPFLGSTTFDTLAYVVNAEPVSPRRLNPNVPRDLETICLKCLQKEPHKRYANATELAEDLAGFQRGEPVLARPVARAERFVRWCRRNPVVAGLTGALLLVFVIGFAIVTAKWIEAVAEREEKEQALALAEKNERDATERALSEEKLRAAAEKSATAEQEANRQLERTIYVQSLALAYRHWQASNVDEAEALLDRCPLHLRGPEWHYLKRLCPTHQLVMRKHRDTVVAVAYSPDGRYIASGSYDKTLKVWDAETGVLVYRLNGHDAIVYGVAFSPDGRLLASAGADKKVRIWDMNNGKEQRVFDGHTGEVRAVAFSPNGRRIASGGADDTILVWEAATGQVERRWNVSLRLFASVAFSPDSKLVAAGDVDGRVHVWDVELDKEMKSIPAHERYVSSVAFSPDGGMIVSGGFIDKKVKCWDAKTGTLLRTLQGHRGQIARVAVSPDGRRIVSASWDRTIKVWDAATGQEQMTLRGHAGFVNGLALSPDGRRVAAGSGNSSVGEIKVWDIAGGQEARLLRGHTSSIFGLAVHPSGQLLASGSADGFARLWDAQNALPYQVRRQPKELPVQPSDVSAVAFSRDGNYFALACREFGKDEKGASKETGVIKVWDCRTWTELPTIRGHVGIINAIAFDPATQHLSTAGRDRVIRIWNAATGQEVRTLAGHKGTIYSLAFNSDGTILASGGVTSVRLWDASTGRELRELTGHTSEVKGLAFSRDGKMLAAGCGDITAFGEVRLWEPGTGKAVRTLRGHASSIMSLDFDPLGQRLVTAGFDGNIKLWDLADGRDLLTLPASAGSVMSVIFAPDGRWFASGSDDGTVRLWDVAATQEIFTLRGHSDWNNWVGFSPDGCRLASASDDKTVRIWDPTAGRELLVLRGLGSNVNGASWSPDGGRIAAGAGVWDKEKKAYTVGELMVWDTKEGKELLRFPAHENRISWTAFSPDGRRIATTSHDRTARVWDASNGQEMLALRGHEGSVWTLAWSPDGSKIATCSEDRTARIWDSNTGKELHSLTKHTGSVVDVSFSPDGQWVATASADRTVKLWSATTGQAVRTFTGHAGTVQTVVFRRDGQRIATVSDDGTVRAWEVKTGREVLRLYGQSGYLRGVAYSPDGQRLASTGEDNAVRLWDARENLAEVEESLRSASEKAADWHRREAADCETARQWQAALFHLEWQLKAAPRDASLLNRLGHALVELNRWSDAIAAYERARTASPDDWHAWLYLAMSHLHLGNQREYRAVCADMLARFGATMDADAAMMVIWTCVLAPDAVPDRDRLVKLGQRALGKRPGNADIVFLLAAAHYRNGQYADALLHLNNVQAQARKTVQMALFFAMSHHHAKNPEEAGRWLDLAIKTLDGANKEKVEEFSKQMWYQREPLLVLREEAEKLIRGKE